MQYLLNAEQMKSADSHTIQDLGVSSRTLMERAAAACIDYIEEQKKKELYNSENIFKVKENIVENYEKGTITEETAIIEYKEKNFLQKIFDKIKHLFKRN